MQVRRYKEPQATSLAHEGVQRGFGQQNRTDTEGDRPGQKSKDWLSGSPLLCRKSEASRVAINHY